MHDPDRSPVPHAQLDQLARHDLSRRPGEPDASLRVRLILFSARGVLGPWLEAGTLATSRRDVHGQPQATISLIQEAQGQIDHYAMMDARALQMGYLLLEDCPPWLVELYRLARRATAARLDPLAEELQRGRPRQRQAAAAVAWALPPGDHRDAIMEAARSDRERLAEALGASYDATYGELLDLVHNLGVLAEVSADGAAKGAREDARQQLVAAVGAPPDAAWDVALRAVRWMFDQIGQRCQGRLGWFWRRVYGVPRSTP